MKIAVLGAGPGGYVAALKAARLGADVTVIEKDEVGGVCLNRGCIPTKTMIASTELLAKTRDLDKFGLELTGSIIPNLSRIVDRKNKVIAAQIKGIRGLLKNLGVRLIEGSGRLISSREIEVAGKDGLKSTVSADRIILATGSAPAAIPSMPFDGTSIITSTEALDLTEIPKSILVIGAGVIGCEFAFIFRELGSEVTVVEMADRALAAEDTEISELLEREMKKKKIRLLTGSKIAHAESKEDGVHAFISDGAEIVAEKALVSIGRTFNTSGIGLEDAGVETGPRGEVLVNSRMETSMPGIFAAGDLTGGLLLAHVASVQGIIAAKNALGADEAYDASVIPSAVFTSPEIGSVGLREQEAKEQGIDIRTGRYQYRSLGKAHAMGEISGIFKVIADASTGKVLGAHIIGPHASDLIHEAALAIRTGRTALEIADMVHAHPTLSEGLMEAAADVFGEAVHAARK